MPSLSLKFESTLPLATYIQCGHRRCWSSPHLVVLNNCAALVGFCRCALILRRDSVKSLLVCALLSQICHISLDSPHLPFTPTEGLVDKFVCVVLNLLEPAYQKSVPNRRCHRTVETLEPVRTLSSSRLAASPITSLVIKYLPFSASPCSVSSCQTLCWHLSPPVRRCCAEITAFNIKTLCVVQASGLEGVPLHENWRSVTAASTENRRRLVLSFDTEFSLCNYLCHLLEEAISFFEDTN